MAKRDLDAIRNELDRLADNIDVTLSVRIDGEIAPDFFSVEGLTHEEQVELDSAIEEAIDEAHDLIQERVYDALTDLDLDEDYDPDEEEAEAKAAWEVGRPQRLADERAALLRKLAEVDA